MDFLRARNWIISVFICTLSAPFLFSQDVIFNEFMASNDKTVADEDGDYSDWIELFNAGQNTVNLEGWGISDNESNPFKWVFPDVIMGPGEYLLVWASGKNRFYGTLTEEMILVDPGADWHYLDNGSNQGTAWRSPSFDDSAWASGPAPLGYGPLENYVTTTVGYGPDSNNKYITTYFRRHFEVENIERIVSLLLSLWIDDGAVVYLNGVELVRELMPAGEISYLTPSSTYVAAWPSWTHYPLPVDALQEGTNVLAVEVHQTAGTSSDVAFDLRLLGNVLATSLHTNFSISAAGEPLTLTRPDETAADTVGPVAVPRDTSYGRVADGGTSWGFSQEPTPGSSNNDATWYSEILDAPQVSHPGGFYTAPFALALNYDDPDVTIYYTLDGSEPDPDNLGGATYVYKNWYPVGTWQTPTSTFYSRQKRTYAYSAPLQITDRSSGNYQLASINTQFSYSTRLPSSNIFKGTVVRARAFKDNAIPSRSVTHTYFVNPGMMTRYALPVISVVTDEDNFFDYYKGIYVAGKVGDDWRLANPSTGWNEGMPANYNQRGIEWERPAHFEMFTSNGTPMLSQNIGTRIHGGWSRGWFPKSIRLYARSEYDDENVFEYPFFAGLEKRGEPGTPLTTFRRLVIRNSGNDFDKTYFRDALMHELVKHLQLDTMAYRPAVHFINGEYWGMINLRERYDDEYLQMHYGIDPEDAVILTYSDAQVDTGFATDRDHFTAAVTYAQNNDPAQTVHYNWLCERIDPDNLAQYYAVQIYYDNTDWPHNNIDYWRKRTDTHEPEAPYGQDGRWRWLLYDTDFGMSLFGASYANNSLNRVMTQSLGLPNTLFNRMRRNTQFRNTFINAMADNMNTSFKPARVHAMVDTIAARIASSRSEHNSRWQINLGAGGEMKTFATQRPAYVRTHILNAFGLSGTQTLTISRNENWGHVQVNSILINIQTPGINPSGAYPWTGEYYRGVPVTVRALPRHGYRFSHWLNAPSGADPFSETLTLSLTSNVLLTAVFEEPALMHYWSFNDAEALLAPTYTLGGAAAGLTTAALSDTGQDFAGINNRLGEPTGSHLRVNNPLGATLTLNLPTTGYEQAVLMVETRRSGQGAGEQTYAYSTDGQAFTPFETIAVYDDVPVLHTFDFSGLAGVDNNPNFAVRISFAQGGGGVEGNNRFDNISLDAIPLPGTNQPPKLIASLPFREAVEESPVVVNLNTYFSDPDGDLLTFTAWTDKPLVVGPSVADHLLTLSPLYRGDAVVTVQASDGVTTPIQNSFRVLVYPKAHPLSDGDFTFGDWSPEQPENTFPESMLFLQSDTSDPTADTPLLYPYFIPHDGDDGYHADDLDIIGFPYMTTGRTRLNGLDEDGISFINTGRLRDLGGALIALDTSTAEAVGLSWVCQTLHENFRQYGIRLQYRIGPTGSFADVLDEGTAVEYLSGGDGHTQVFGPIRLPDAAMGRPHVQLLWRYYHVSGTSGARAQIRLDDIEITVPSCPFGGLVREIPERIEAEEFDVGGEGQAYHDTTAGNSGGSYRPNVDVDIVSVIDGTHSGYAVSDIQDGEWLLYTVNSTAGETDVYARVASTQAGGQIRIRLDDELIATIDVPNTGSLTTWETVLAPCLPLPERENAKLKLEFAGTEFRLNWVHFVKQMPYLGIPSAIPGRLEFEDYDTGGQFISFNDKTAVNGYGKYRPDEPVDIMTTIDGVSGYAVYADGSEWLEYTCVIDPGFYTITVRSASTQPAQQFSMSLDGQFLRTFTLPNTGGWQHYYQDTFVSDVYMPGGVHVLRFKLENALSLLNYVDFTRLYNAADITRSGRVELDDFAVLAAQWMDVPGTPSADIAPPPYGDGVVDLMDFLFLAENWLME